jgi:hypothetical protein
MVELGTSGRRAIPAGSERRAQVGASLKHFLAVVAGITVMGLASPSHAQDSEPPPSPLALQQADCLKRLEPAEQAIETDYKYARAWTDTWTVASSSLVILNLTQAFMVSDYKRYESLALAASSLLLQIQRPVALWNDDALKEIRAAKVQDPCLALADASHVMKSTQVDGELHRSWPIYLINAGFNLAVMAVAAFASQHFDFVGDSNLGLQTLAGIALSELQTFTYPRGSFRTSGNAIEVTF